MTVADVAQKLTEYKRSVHVYCEDPVINCERETLIAVDGLKKGLNSVP